jgi:hypothetical protein
MTTASHTTGTTRHRIAWITGPLTVALLALSVFNDYVAPMDAALGVIACFAALWAAVATGFCAGNRAMKRAAWIAAPICWILTLYAWFGYIWTGSSWPLGEALVTPVFIMLLAMPPGWLLLAAWRPRSRAGSHPAETGAVAVLVMSLFVLTIYISSAVEPASPAGWLALVYTAAGALLATTAWRRPDRRIAYGFLAILLAAIAIGSPWLFHSDDPDAVPPGFIGIEVFAPGALVVGALAAALQAAWTARQRSRAAEPEQAAN